MIQTQHNYTDDFRHDGIAYQLQSMQPDLRTLMNSTLRNPRTLPKTGHPAATHSVFHIDHTRLSAETMIGNQAAVIAACIENFRPLSSRRAANAMRALNSCFSCPKTRLLDHLARSIEIPRAFRLYRRRIACLRAHMNGFKQSRQLNH